MLLFGVFVFSWKSVPHYVAIFLPALCLKMENAFMVVSVSAIYDIQYTQVLVAYAGIGEDCQGQMERVRKWRGGLSTFFNILSLVNEIW